jgi:peptidoglycan/xylan/chitin deacetylase (PgdA/CDA1 family)
MARHSRGRSGSNQFVLVAAIAAVIVLAGAALGAWAFAGRGAAARPEKRATTKPAASKPASKPQPKPATKPVTTQPPAEPAAEPSSAPASGGKQVVPVLMYHHIMPNPNNSIAITPETFEKQMKWLSDHGYHAVTTAQMDAFETKGTPLPSKPVLITLDDGRSNQLTYGVPIMKKYGFTATFFVVKKWVESSSKSFMHVGDLKQLSAEGFDIQSHTSNHMMMRRVKLKSTGTWESYEQMKARLWYPTDGMRLWLSEVIGKPVTAVAYPGGGKDQYSPRLMQEAGYTTAYIGKWHMGGQRGQRPGFDYSASFIGQGRYWDCPFEVNGEAKPSTGWVDDVSTDYAIEFIKTHRDQPFNLVVGFKACHDPRTPPERAKDRFANERARRVPNMDVRAIYAGEGKPRKANADRPNESNIDLNYFR